jgi:hypothetical protein
MAVVVVGGISAAISGVSSAAHHQQNLHHQHVIVSIILRALATAWTRKSDGIAIDCHQINN